MQNTLTHYKQQSKEALKNKLYTFLTCSGTFLGFNHFSVDNMIRKKQQHRCLINNQQLYSFERQKTNMSKLLK